MYRIRQNSGDNEWKQRLFRLIIMKEIDNMLNTWIRNSIIRNKLRELIVNEIKKYKNE